MATKPSIDSSKYIKRLWILVLSPFLLFGLIVLLTSWNVFGELPSVEELQNPQSNLASAVYSSDMKVLGKFYKENRTNAKYADLNPYIINALKATEDARFDEHSGVDLKALLRAVSGVLGGGSKGGGSTLSQQLAKMLFPRKDLNKFELVFKKIKEWIVAARLERNYTKEEIMTMYLNKFDFLNLAVGIKSASQIYFAKAPKDLSIQESALLVGMCQNPSMYNPVNVKKSERAKLRRNVVLFQMVKYDYLTRAKFDSLKVLPIKLSFSPEDHNDGLAPYFREYLRDIYLKEWCENHKRPDGKPYDIYRDGLKIYTSIDSRMQQYAEESVKEHLTELQKQFWRDLKNKKNAPFDWRITTAEGDKIVRSSMKRTDRYRILKKAGKSDEAIESLFKSEKVDMRIFSWKGDRDTTLTPWDSIKYYKSFLQTGFMAMEPQTGYVKAWVGGINHKYFKYDHVKVGTRQVGSTFKPFVYALAIREGYSPCHKVANVKTCIEGPGKTWCPDNSDNRFNGKEVTLRFALANSINYVSAWVIKQFGPQAVINLVKQMGVTAEIPAQYAIALGSADISVFEMVGANSTFANKGTYTQPIFVTRIEDKNGKVLEEFIPKTTEVLNEEKAYVMLQLMRGVVDYGTGTGLRRRYGLMNQIAGKTGTTQNNSDGWFMGITPELVAGAWVGAEDRSVHFSSTAQGQGATMALPIWGKFFKKVYDDKTLKVSKGEFKKPAGLGNIELDCSKYDAENADLESTNEENDNPFNDMDEIDPNAIPDKNIESKAEAKKEDTKKEESKNSKPKGNKN
jgi:penicillin-binding protein 1A